MHPPTPQHHTTSDDACPCIHCAYALQYHCGHMLVRNGELTDKAAWMTDNQAGCLNSVPFWIPATPSPTTPDML